LSPVRLHVLGTCASAADAQAQASLYHSSSQTVTAAASVINKPALLSANIAVLADLFKQGYITEHALVWTEGQDSWQPLRTCQGLYEKLVFGGTIRV
jgi:hypothetical protein